MLALEEVLKLMALASREVGAQGTTSLILLGGIFKTRPGLLSGTTPVLSFEGCSHKMGEPLSVLVVVVVGVELTTGVAMEEDVDVKVLKIVVEVVGAEAALKM